MHFPIYLDLIFHVLSKKIRKLKKNFVTISHPFRVAPSGHHNSAQGSKFKKRLDEFICIGILVVHTKLHDNWSSSLLGTDFGSGNGSEQFLIRGIL